MSAAEFSKPSATIPLTVGMLVQFLGSTWQVYLASSPYILLGLAAAGLLHVLIPADRIARWLGKPGWGSTTRAALLGIPLPLCSCGVVPVTIELSRKGASREASLAFLVSTPETGVDSIALTYGLMGPVMAIARPIAALVTSLVAATASIFWRGGTPPEQASAPPSDPNCCDESPPATPARTSTAGERLAAACRYGFRQMVDEIGFWLIVGLILTGAITALIPERWFTGVLGQGATAMFVLLVMGIPLYMCASASTPIGAALLLKGFSAGAVLVFLLAGPATNASSLVVIARFFGRRFVVLYLSSVVVTALALGWLLDLALARLGLEVVAHWTTSHHEVTSWIGWICALALGLLLLDSLRRGAWRMAIADFTRDMRSWKRLLQ